MYSTKAPEQMTPEERLAEVASILAAGFLRLKSRRGYVPAAKSEAPWTSENCEKNSRN